MELAGNEVLITKDTANNNDLGVNDGVGYAFPSVTGDLTANNESVNTIADHVRFNNSAFEDNIEKERKRKRHNEEEAERKRIAQEAYDKQLHEQRYKRLMHLLNKSQFYTTFLTKKISQITLQEIKAKSDEKEVASAIDENKPPQKERKKWNAKGYDIRQYISASPTVNHMEKRISLSKSKLNLSEEEITNELLTFDEETHVDHNERSDIPKYFNGSLYKYQVEGLQWLKVLYENGLNGILADEMGLGKTIQIIALLCHLIEKRQDGPYLIIVPLSTMPNWISEFEKFAPSLPVIVLHGTKDEKLRLSKQIKQSYQIVQGYRTQPIVITTFEVPLLENKFLCTQKWRYIIIDEGHRIKNYKCQLAKVLRTMKSMNRLLLTGTPLQNDLAELWSLLNFLLPEIFDDLAVFESWFNSKEMQHTEGTEKILKQEQEKQVLSSLREILKPFMLRREKSDVNLNIPPKKELIVYAPLTQLQHNLYKAVLNYDIHNITAQDPIVQITGHRPKRRCVLKNATNIYGNLNDQLISNMQNGNDENISANSVSWTTGEIKSSNDLSKWEEHTDINDQNREFLKKITSTNRWIIYKKIVNHPYLLHHPLNDYGLPEIDDDILNSSGKLIVLDAMLARLKSQGHKVLLFSTMTMILDIIENYLSLRDYNYVRLDGTVKLEDRSRDIERFNTEPELFLFLISTRAGGTGLNLAAADTVIIYDSDWNPQVDIQAMARCHRIGQTRPVVIYKLCTKGTIDEAIIKRAGAKRILEKMVISKELRKLNVHNKETLLELKHLLASTESKVIASKRDEAELNELLDRSDLVQSKPIDVEKVSRYDQ